jgi:type IV secretory pathway TrbD component
MAFPRFLKQLPNSEGTQMTHAKRINRIQRSLSRPLTILGAERKLFFFAMCLGATTFNLLSSLLGGMLIFLLLYFAARWATQTDPQILRFLLTAAKLRSQYDPAKFSPVSIRRTTDA